MCSINSLRIGCGYLQVIYAVASLKAKYSAPLVVDFGGPSCDAESDAESDATVPARATARHDSAKAQERGRRDGEDTEEAEPVAWTL